MSNSGGGRRIHTQLWIFVPDHEHFTPEQVIAALDKHRGLVFLAARELGCHVNTVRNYRRNHPEVGEVYKAHKGIQVDEAVSKLMDGVEAGEPWAVLFTLRTIGKGRGYVERVETTGKDGRDLHATRAQKLEEERAWVARLLETEKGREAFELLSVALAPGGVE